MRPAGGRRRWRGIEARRTWCAGRREEVGGEPPARFDLVSCGARGRADKTGDVWHLPCTDGDRARTVPDPARARTLHCRCQSAAPTRLTGLLQSSSLSLSCIACSRIYKFTPSFFLISTSALCCHVPSKFVRVLHACVCSFALPVAIQERRPHL